MPSGQSAFSNIQLSSVPMAIYIYCRIADNSLKWTDTDVAVTSISSLSIQFDNTPAMISEFKAIDLYCMAVRNGLNASFNEFIGY